MLLLTAGAGGSVRALQLNQHKRSHIKGSWLVADEFQAICLSGAENGGPFGHFYFFADL
jgi:hypothetical protein